jgi:hypothetical protein
MATTRTYVWSLVWFTNKFCRLITDHAGIFKAALATVITDPTDLATLNSMLDAVVAGCAMLQKYYPNMLGT